MPGLALPVTIPSQAVAPVTIAVRSDTAHPSSVYPMIDTDARVGRLARRGGAMTL